MSIFLNFIRKGNSVVRTATFGERLAVWIGRRLALRHKNVSLGKGVMISPDAMVNPRCGKIEIGDNSIVSPYAILQGNIKIGKNVSVQARTMLIGYGTCEDQNGIISIGDNSRIAPNCMLIAADHVFADPDKPIRMQGMKPGSIIIEDDLVLEGVVINDNVQGNGAANSNISGTIQDMTLADRTLYIQSVDATSGICVILDNKEANNTRRYDKVQIYLKGAVLTRKDAPVRYSSNPG